MGWLSPPDRREITLVLFCTAVYILAYNLETSLQLLGVDSVATSGALFSHIGLGKTRAIDRDGRKPNGWRDQLEHDIYGDWKWDEGHVAGNGDERSQKVGSDRHGAAWASKNEIGDVKGGVFGDVSVGEALKWWKEDVPQTKIVQHTPGYTILDNVFIHNGAVYLVSDDTKDFPPILDIVSSEGVGFPKWTLLTKHQALTLFGDFGGMIRGVSWMAADTEPHNSTLLTLWRTHTSSPTPLTPPHRLILPHTHYFTDPDPDFAAHTVRRRRADTGFHPYLLKIAFPQLSVLYFEDMDDYAKMEGVPFVLEKLVVVDRKAASRGGGGYDDGEQSGLEAIFSLTQGGGERGEWWTPIRQNVIKFLDLDLDEEEKKRKVVTYFVTQGGVPGRPKLKDDDHEKLVSALKRMERNLGCDVQVFYEDTSRTTWVERMEAIVRSTIVLGVHGDHLMDFAFMKDGEHSTLVEMYPKDKFVRDRAVIAESIGLKYVAWSGSEKYETGNLPQPSRPLNTEEVTIDVDAVVKSVQQIVSKA